MHAPEDLPEGIGTIRTDIERPGLKGKTGALIIAVARKGEIIRSTPDVKIRPGDVIYPTGDA
jgi:K+/H+ antiporter YhaU regulatory subunit KhtT